MLKILNSEPDGYSREARTVLDMAGEVREKKFSVQELLEAIKDYDVLIVRLGFKLDRRFLDEAERLKAVVTATTGLDHIDADYARQRGIEILSLKGEYAYLKQIHATAEHSWGLLLALLRKIPWAFDSVRSGAWDRNIFIGRELDGKKLGIVGLGRIGEKIAAYGQAFGMRVYGFDPYKSEWPDSIIKCDSPGQLSWESDILSVHVPLNPETELLIGKDELERLGAEGVIINTSRGAVVDSEALLCALKSGAIAGAALDVLCEENAIESGFVAPLIRYAGKNSNLLITPHIGGATVESMRKTEIFMAGKLLAWAEGRGLIG